MSGEGEGLSGVGKTGFVLSSKYDVSHLMPMRYSEGEFDQAVLPSMLCC